MAASIEHRVFEELASMLEGSAPFPTSERKDHADLLSEFPPVAKCVDTNSHYDTMETLITLMYCRYHREDASDAFHEWKVQRKKAAPNSPPMTSSGGATPHTSSSESLPHLGSMNLSSAAPDSPGHGDLSLDSLTEQIKGLNIKNAEKTTNVEADHPCSDEDEEQMEKLKRIGVAHFPDKGKGYIVSRIDDAVRNPLDAKVMSGGILYVLEHTKVSGIFKIGYTKSSAALRLKQSKNCYNYGTRPIHETEGGAFIGVRQAEKIAHAILRHKRLLFFQCTQCKGYHKEWFLVSRKEAIEVVKLAERWLRMPAYTLHQQEGKYKLTPEGDAISQLMFPFSTSKMDALMNQVDKSANDSGAFSAATPVASIRQPSAFNVSSGATKNEIPRVIVNESHASTPPESNHPQKKPPLGDVSNEGLTCQVEYEEISEERESRSRETTPEGHYLFVKKKTIRKKVSISKMGHNNGPNSSQIDVTIKDQAGEAVIEVREVHTA
ncbi:T5orf172 domain-containing protein [Trichoderma simmonsii]|uniref:T5orf172 domain-containing protein n=1 Tax=Trichoderma simmonsii TaxID=1491479 RepID=A0A8G0LQE8_9HYPO|nr:T5orf172 domain-containing protein [Trichoderma simmonsii]